MNTLQDLATLAGYRWQKQASCCPHKGYRGDTVFAVVRASTTTRYIFADGRTLTIGHKTRYATFPRPDHPLNAVTEAMEELREKHPLTSNLYVTET